MIRALSTFSIALLLALGVGRAEAFDPLQRAERAAQAGLRSLAAGDTTEAIEQMLRAQALAPDDPEIRHALGEVFYRGGEYESAQRQFESLVVDPVAPPVGPSDRMDPASTLYNAANAAFRQQDYEQALELYTEALLELPEEAAPGEDLLHNLELSQRMLESAQSQSESGEGEPDPDQQQEPQEDQESDQQQEGEPQSQEQDPSQEQESPPEESEQPEAAADSTQSQTPPDSSQTRSAPPDSLAEAAPESLQSRPEVMTAAEAMRLLEALDHEEEELRRSIQRRLRGGETESERDW